MPRTRSLGYGLIGSAVSSKGAHGPKGGLNNGGGKGKGQGPSTSSQNQGGGGGSDPYFSSVKLLLPLEANFTDLSGSPHTTTNVGSVTIDTVNKVFGAGSAALNGSSQYLKWAGSPDWNIGAGSFTIEMFYRPTAGMTSVNQSLLAQGPAGGTVWHFFTNNAGGGNVNIGFAGAATRAEKLGWTPVINQWYHLAYCYNAGEGGTGRHRLFIDGVLAVAANVSGTQGDDTSFMLLGSSEGNGFRLTRGNIQNVRFTKGVARYTSDASFSVPTSAYPTS